MDFWLYMVYGDNFRLSDWIGIKDIVIILVDFVVVD